MENISLDHFKKKKKFDWDFYDLFVLFLGVKTRELRGTKIFIFYALQET